MEVPEDTVIELQEITLEKVEENLQAQKSEEVLLEAGA